MGDETAQIPTKRKAGVGDVPASVPDDIVPVPSKKAKMGEESREQIPASM
jgi:hypothetical protein